MKGIILELKDIAYSWSKEFIIPPILYCPFRLQAFRPGTLPVHFTCAVFSGYNINNNISSVKGIAQWSNPQLSEPFRYCGTRPALLQKHFLFHKVSQMPKLKSHSIALVLSDKVSVCSFNMPLMHFIFMLHLNMRSKHILCSCYSPITTKASWNLWSWECYFKSSSASQLQSVFTEVSLDAVLTPVE